MKEDTRVGNPEETARREVEVAPGLYVVEGVAPKAGTRLTPELVKEDLRALSETRRQGMGPENGHSSPAETPEEVARRGREIYDRELRAGLERDHPGAFVVIDVQSGDHEVAGDDLEASEKLLRRRPDAVLYGQPVGTGSRASARIGSSPKAPWP